MAYGEPLGRESVLVVASVICGRFAPAAGPLRAPYLAVTYKISPASRGLVVNPGVYPSLSMPAA